MDQQQDNEPCGEQGRGRVTLASLPLELTGIVALALLASFIAQLTWPHYGPALIWICHYSFGLSLAVLLAIVSAVIRRSWEIYVATYFLLLLDGFALAAVMSGQRLEILLVLLPMFVATPILITLESIKIFLGTFTKSKSFSPPFFEAFRFEIKHIFVATAVLAMFIVFAQTLVSYFSSGGKRTHLILTTIVALLSANALVSVWAMLGRTVGFRVGIALITAVLFLIAAMQTLIYFDHWINANDMWFWISCTAFSWVTSSLQLYLFRRQGYRFVRHAK